MKFKSLLSSIVQEEATKEVENEETLELSEIITQEGLKSSPPMKRFWSLIRSTAGTWKSQTRVPKYQQLDVKLYVLLRDDQLEFLAKLTRGDHEEQDV